MLPDLVNPVVDCPPKSAGRILAYSHQACSEIKRTRGKKEGDRSFFTVMSASLSGKPVESKEAS